MKNKGYTLIELLGVMVILAVLITFVFPSIIDFIKKNNDGLDEQTKLLITNAAELYLEDNSSSFPGINGKKYMIEIQDLIDSGNLPKSVKLSNLKNIGENYVLAIYNNNKFDYKVKAKSDFYNISGTNNLIIDSDSYDFLDYKIYGNSVQDGTPTTESPIEIESVGEKTKNLFNKAIPPFYTNSSKLTYEETETGVKFINPSISSANAYITSVYKIDSVENIGANTIYVSSDVELGGVPKALIALGYCDKDGSNRQIKKELSVRESGKHTTSLKIDSTTYAGKDICLFLYSIAYAGDTILELEDGTYVEYSNLMISVGESEYEPYGKYKIPVKVSGKNLLNFDELLTNWGATYTKEDNTYIFEWKSVFYTNEQKLDLDVGKNYTLSLKQNDLNTRTNVKITIRYLKEDGTYTGVGSVNADIGRGVSSVGFTVREGREYYIRLDYGGGSGNLYYTEPQLEEGSKTSYEPYMDKVTNIYLNEPLRKIGDYADYIDFENGKIVRNIKEYVLDGTEKLQIVSTNKDDKKRFYVQTQGTKISGNSDYTVYCSHYAQGTNSKTYACVQGCSGFKNLNQSTIYDEKHQTIEDFRAFLKEQYNNGNPVKIYGILENSTKESIELPNLPTLNATTTLSIDTNVQPSNVEILYYED